MAPPGHNQRLAHGREADDRRSRDRSWVEPDRQCREHSRLFAFEGPFEKLQIGLREQVSDFCQQILAEHFPVDPAALQPGLATRRHRTCQQQFAFDDSRRHRRSEERIVGRANRIAQTIVGGLGHGVRIVVQHIVRAPVKFVDPQRLLAQFLLFGKVGILTLAALRPSPGIIRHCLIQHCWILPGLIWPRADSAGPDLNCSRIGELLKSGGLLNRSKFGCNASPAGISSGRGRLRLELVSKLTSVAQFLEALVHRARSCWSVDTTPALSASSRNEPVGTCGEVMSPSAVR